MEKKKSGFDFEKLRAWVPSEEQRAKAKAEFRRLIEEGAFALPDNFEPMEHPAFQKLPSLPFQVESEIFRLMDEIDVQRERLESPQFRQWLAIEYEAEDRAYREEMARIRARDDWNRTNGETVKKATDRNAQADRQASRWQACIDAGLTMPTDTYGPMPRGIGKIAKSMGIKRQSLAQDLNAHRERLFGR